MSEQDIYSADPDCESLEGCARCGSDHPTSSGLCLPCEDLAAEMRLIAEELTK